VIRKPAVLTAALFAFVTSAARAELVPAATFSGSAQLKGDGFEVRQPYSLQVSLDADALAFQAQDDGGALYNGNLARKGRRGHKLSFYVDIASSEAFAADVAARAAAASGESAGAVLGQSAKLVLSAREDGSSSLKIVSEVLVEGVGVVAFKANLAGVEAAASAPAASSARAKRNSLFDIIVGIIGKYTEIENKVVDQLKQG
jgi:hypothetical protein